MPKGFNKLIAQNKLAYNNLNPKKIESIFISLHSVRRKIFKCNGTNTFKIPWKSNYLIEGITNVAGGGMVGVTPEASVWLMD